MARGNLNHGPVSGRRHFLQSIGATVSAVAIAGCMGQSDGGGGETGGDEGPDGAQGTAGDGGTTAGEELSISVGRELSLPVGDPAGVTFWDGNLVVTDGAAESENVVVLEGKSETVLKRATIEIDGGRPSLAGATVEGGRSGAFILRALEQSTGAAYEYGLVSDYQEGSVAMPGVTPKGFTYDPADGVWMVASRDGKPDGFYRVDKSTGDPITMGHGPPDALDVPGGTGWGLVFLERELWVCNPEQRTFHGYWFDFFHETTREDSENGDELGTFSVSWDAKGCTFDGELIWSIDVGSGTLKGFEPPR